MKSFVDKWSNRIASMIVFSKKESFVYEPLPEIRREIEQLKHQIAEKTKDADRHRINWVNTFDAMSDNIVIIGEDMNILTANKSFCDSMVALGCPWPNIIGINWLTFKAAMGMDNRCIVGNCFSTGEPQDAIVDFNGTIFHIIANPIIEDDKVVRVVRVSRNITDLEFQKRKLERRGKVLRAISEMSKTLTNHEDWDTAVSKVLEQLGSALGVHRVYIYNNTTKENRACALLTGVWYNPNGLEQCTSKGVLTDCVNYERLDQWKSFMENGLSVQGNMTNCDICPEKTRCACLDDIVVSAVPIYSNGLWWGFIGFDYHNGTKKWRCDDEVSLRVAADIIGGVIYHRSRYYNTLNTLQQMEDKE